MGVGQLAEGPCLVAGDRPHREHAEALLTGEVLQQLGVGGGEYLAGDVVYADHRRYAELVPAEADSKAAMELAELAEAGVGGIDGVLAHGLQGRRCGAVAVIHGHDVDAIKLHSRRQGLTHHFQAVGCKALRYHGQGVPDL